MKYRFIGNTGLLVSELSLGSLTFAANPQWNMHYILSQVQINNIVDRAIDYGINFFDTADIYGSGQAEHRLGKAICKNRDKVLLASKVNYRTSNQINEAGLSRSHIMSQIEKSLKNLKTDYLDFYFIHGFDKHTNIEDTITTLDELVKKGKVRYLGVSNILAWQIVTYLHKSQSLNKEYFRCTQLHYSILDRGIEREFVSMQTDYNLGCFVWGGLSSGLLTGKYLISNCVPNNARRNSNDFPPVTPKKAKKILEELKVIADSSNISMSQLSIYWLLSKKFITSVILGVTSEGQLIDNLKATTLQLPEEHLQRINDISKLSLEYPKWYLDIPSDRLIN